ncbi:hypothetical protein [Pseudoxanthomonas sp. USHLN014]|uniref:hypothetical protein n=1 Tax=Pseudoxanthomonas sp. USHLN014 TaxID=3081297 RepID=UPI00301D289D
MLSLGWMSPRIMESIMALSDEWEDQHLTPSGWVSGSYKHDHGHREEKPIPPDTVLSVRRHVVVGALGAMPSVSESRQVRGGADPALVAELEENFGPPIFGC